MFAVISCSSSSKQFYVTSQKGELLFPAYFGVEYESVNNENKFELVVMLANTCYIKRDGEIIKIIGSEYKQVYIFFADSNKELIYKLNI